MTTNNERNLVIIFGSIFLALLLLFLILLKSYEKELSTIAAAEPVAIDRKMNDQSSTLNSTDVNIKSLVFGQSKILTTCIKGLEFVVYIDHDIDQVFEPTENNSQSIPKRCNQ